MANGKGVDQPTQSELSPCEGFVCAMREFHVLRIPISPRGRNPLFLPSHRESKLFLLRKINSFFQSFPQSKCIAHQIEKQWSWWEIRTAVLSITNFSRCTNAREKFYKINIWLPPFILLKGKIYGCFNPFTLISLLNIFGWYKF